MQSVVDIAQGLAIICLCISNALLSARMNQADL